MQENAVDVDSGSGGGGGPAALDSIRRAYAEKKARTLSNALQETSVAKFELDHLPAQREVYQKRGSLLYLVRRAEAKERLETRERQLTGDLAVVEAVLADPR